MKTLRFTTHEQFELTYEAAVGRPQGYNIQESRTIAKILDKYEAVGLVKEIKHGVSLYSPSVVLPLEIALEDTEFVLLQQVFREIAWSGAGARVAVAVDDWLSECARG